MMFKYYTYHNEDIDNKVYVMFATGVNPVAFTSNSDTFPSPVWRIMDWAMVQLYGIYSDEFTCVVAGKVRALTKKTHTFDDNTLNSLLNVAYTFFDNMFGSGNFRFSSLPFGDDVVDERVKHMYITVYTNMSHKTNVTQSMIKRISQYASVSYWDKSLEGNGFLQESSTSCGEFRRHSMGIDEGIIFTSSGCAFAPFVQLDHSLLIKEDIIRKPSDPHSKITIVGVDKEQSEIGYLRHMWDDAKPKTIRYSRPQCQVTDAVDAVIPSVFKMKPNFMSGIAAMRTWSTIEIVDKFLSNDLVPSIYYTIKARADFSVIRNNELVLF